MQHIAHILLVQSLLLHEFEDVIILLQLQEFLSFVAFRQHVKRDDVWQAVVVEIGDIRPHGELRHMCQCRIRHIAECLVAIVQVEMIGFVVIICGV